MYIFRRETCLVKVDLEKFSSCIQAVLPDGSEIAVKRLSKESAPEPTKQGQLDWTKRFWNGKDFGDGSIPSRYKEGSWNLCYIAPEYMMRGEFSTKSDVYSFGVIVLEIISGKRSSSFHETDESGKTLITHAWRHWKDGTPLELVDGELGGNYQSDEVIKCIHIALLCVQIEPEKRLPLSDIIPVLTSNSNSLPLPQSPPYEGLEFGLPPINSVHGSANDSLISDFVPR